MQTANKPAVYLRCSSRTQDTEAQRSGLQRYLDGNGIRVDPSKWFEDHAVSGGTMDRPALNRLNEAIFNGEVDTVIFYDVARFARTFIDGLNELDRWQTKGVRLVFVSQGIEVNPAEWSGQVVLKILVAITLAFAESERERIRARMSTGVANATAKTAQARKLLASGRTPGQVAAAIGIKVRQVQWIIDHPKAKCYWGGCEPGRIIKKRATIRKILELRDAGYGPAEIARMLGVGRMTIWRRLQAAKVANPGAVVAEPGIGSDLSVVAQST